MSGGSGVVHNEFNQHLLFNQQVFPESGISGEQEQAYSVHCYTPAPAVPDTEYMLSS